MATGTWGTDADEDSSVSFVGERSVKLISSAVAVDLETEYISIGPASAVDVTVAVRADSSAAGRTLLLRVHWYDTDGAYLSVTDNVVNGLLPSANEWRVWRDVVTAPSDDSVGFMKVSISKNGTTTFNAWVGLVSAKLACRSFNAYRSVTAGGQTIGSGSWVQVLFDDDNWNHGTMFNSANNEFQGPGVVGSSSRKKSIWRVSSAVTFTGVAAGTKMEIAIFLDNAIYARGNVLDAYSGGGYCLVASALVKAQDTAIIDIRVKHDEGSDLDISATFGNSYMCVEEVNPPYTSG